MKIIFKLVILYVCLVACASAKEVINVDLLIVDDDKNPVSGVKVGMGFLLGKGSNVVHGYTDADGRLSASEVGVVGVSILLNKQDYYTSTRRVGRGNQDVIIPLRIIKNPVSLYAKKVRLTLPSTGRKFGFDLEKSDWVVPHGRGLTAHIYFKVDGERQDMFNYDEQLDISFPNEHDGLVKYGEEEQVFESTFRFPYEAPTSGYMNTLTHKRKRWQVKEGLRTTPHGDETYDRTMLGYAFRVNTEADDDGNVVSANYGKINGEILSNIVASNDKKGNAGKGEIFFTYYYNPVKNERSLEFDIHKNLFKNLSRKEKVATP